MCELLGICSNQEVDLNFSFPEWRDRGATNPHGYGFAFWDTGRHTIIKEPTDLPNASEAKTDEVRSARSRTFLCHVRLKSRGNQDDPNTHPFEAKLQGRPFVFAHNGTVATKSLTLRTRHAEGKTDSEHAFLWLMEQLTDASDADFSKRLKERADYVRGLGGFNFLLSDGVTLWAYADHSLHFIKRTPPYGGKFVGLKKDGYDISLAGVKRSDERAVLIATKPLTNEPWTPMTRGELLVVRDGKVRETLGGARSSRITETP